MTTTNFTHIAHLAEICAKRGVCHVVISPGSRNAPLVIAFDNHPEITTYVVHDERSAAFFALGMADELQQPVAVVCTSGSAPLNYAPAISEAYYRYVPLLVLTADRPVDLVDQGDGQTIRQKKLFHNIIKAEYEIPESDLAESDHLVNEAVNMLKTLPCGPVHINIPLSEPLYGTAEIASSPVFSIQENSPIALSTDQKSEIVNGWKSAKKKLILIGQLHPNPELEKELLLLANDPSVAILVENTANIQGFERICHCIDRLLVTIKEDEVENFKPDLLVVYGGAIISKKIKAFFRKHRPENNWKVGIHPFVQDTFQSLTALYGVPELEFTKLLNSVEVVPESNFGNTWKTRDFITQDKHKSFLNSAPYSDMLAFDWILDTLPDDVNLQMGNSSVVRYCQLFDPLKGTRYFSNRGVSGIDGSTSTAVGMAHQSKDRLTVLLSGDISFFYDSNALWNAYLPHNLRIIVINNGGGGIFNIIPGPKESAQNEIFFAPYQASIEKLSESFKINYYRLDTIDRFEEIIGKFYQFQEDNRPAILEIDTSHIPNHTILASYFEFIVK